MAFDDLPPDPYKLLGVAKDAKLPEIRSAHRKLVLKCHPDKVQDAALKAIKQDEFQKVQQAYELLSDEQRRTQYDEQVKLFALRREMGRGNATPRSNPFEYELKTAEPRSTTYTYNTRSATKSTPKETSKVYPQQQRPSSYEDVGREPARHPKKSASYESADRDRKSRSREEERERERERERDIRKHEEDERARAKWEKEIKRSAHGEKKKRSEKERKRGAEEKHSSRGVYMEDDSSDDYRAERAREKARYDRQMEDDIRQRNEAARAEATREAARKTESFRQTPVTQKCDYNQEYARQYMKAAGRKGTSGPNPSEEPRPRPLQRSETYAAPDPKYNIRYAVPPQAAPAYPPSDDDAPRRSAASRHSRRTSESTPTSRGKDTPKSSSKEKEREKDRDKERKRSGRSQSRDPYAAHIVEPPSPPPIPKQMPSLQSYNSAPPIIPGPTPRREPSRSKTQDYPRSKDPSVPPLPRAATFQAGDRAQDRGTQRGSRLKKTVDYSSETDSDSPVYAARHSHSPPPRRREPPQEHTRYIIDNGRSVPISSRAPQRSDMRNIDNEVPYATRDRPDRDRSESPNDTARHPRASERPPLTRAGSGSTRQAPARSHSQTYYPAHPAHTTPPVGPEPIIRDVRPKMAPRESTHIRGSAPGPSPAYFEQVKYSAPLRQQDVIYNENYRQGSTPTHHPHAARDYGYPPPSREHASVYA